MSPEQKENPSLVSYPSDIYSLAIIAYELVLGRLSHGVIHLALLSKRFRAIIEKALKPDPKERYQDIVDFITDISQYIGTLSDEKEEEQEELSDEILNMIQQTRKVLIPQKAPSWPQLEIGIALHEGMSLSGLYLDFFHLPENRYGIILAEPLESGTLSLLQAASLRGMMRMAMRHDHHPLKALKALNETIHQDPMSAHFRFCLILLTPDKDQLSFVSCNYTSLYHILEGSQTIRILSTPNNALGLDPETPLLETTDNWNSGDTLILHSIGLKPEQEDQKWAQEFLILSGQNQAEKILQSLTSQQKILPKRASAVLTIQRIF